MAMPFSSGHVLVPRVFPRNSFASYKSVWHRTPEGTWTIFVDGASLDTACPRYFGVAAKENRSARVDLTWTGPMDLEVKADPPGLRWTMSLTEPVYLAWTPVCPQVGNLRPPLTGRIADPAGSSFALL